MTPEDQVIRTLEQVLQQCNPNDIPGLVKDIKIKLAQRCYALNDQQSLLLNIPPELLVEIGKHVLESKEEVLESPHSGRRDRYWFKYIFPLLQTCSKLRTELQPLRSQSIFYWVTTLDFDQIWAEVMRAEKLSRCKGLHQGKNIFIVRAISSTHKLISAAALAGALECAIHGRLLEKPAVYIRSWSGTDITGVWEKEYYVSHGRDDNMLAEGDVIGWFDEQRKMVSAAEGAEIWKEAKLVDMD